MRGGPTPCASVAAEGAQHRKTLKCQRSRAPKAVNCKRLLGGVPHLLFGYAEYADDVDDAINFVKSDRNMVAMIVQPGR